MSRLYLCSCLIDLWEHRMILISNWIRSAQNHSFFLGKRHCVQTWALYSVMILDQGKENVNSGGVRSMAVGTEAMSRRGPVK